MLDKIIEIKIVSESKTFQEKRKIKIIWVLREEKPSGLMNKAIISSPRLVVPLPPSPQLPLIFTTVTEKFGMTGPCIPRVRILRRWGVAGVGALPWGYFSLPCPLREGSGMVRENGAPSCGHISSTMAQVVEERPSLWAADMPSWSSSSSNHPLRAGLWYRALKTVLCSPLRRPCSELAHWQSSTVWLSFSPGLLLCSPLLQVTMSSTSNIYWSPVLAALLEAV